MYRAAAPKSGALPLSKVISTWWPLAASWLLMGIEGPALSAMVARLANPEINLAAWGGVVFPLSLIIESPIIMLLAASTALSRDWAAYQKLRRFMLISGACLTIIHFLIAFTPAYYWVVRSLIGAPAEIIEPARLGLMIMIPWSWSIAYRRFNQGVLIRFGRSQAVGIGTVIRLSANITVLTAGYLWGKLPGIIVGCSAVATGVISEALYAGLAVRLVLDDVRNANPAPEPVTARSFIAFYVPLIMTSLLTLLANPIGSAALSRMPQALSSLAVWPVVTGLIFMVRSMGIAYNEVVVALLDDSGAAESLKRFAGLLAFATTILLVLIAATPLASMWFGKVSALPPDLANLAETGIWWALPLPALSVLQSWYQGVILHSKRTHGVTESVIVYLIVSILILGAGVAWGQKTGLYIGLASLSSSVLAQTLWLWFKSRPALQVIARME